MRNIDLAWTSVLVFCFCLSCSSKDLEISRAELKGCQEKQQSLTQEANSCRQELEMQRQRLNSFEEALVSTVPKEIVEVRNEVMENIPQEIPAPVKEDLQKELDKYFVAVSREFQHMQRKNEELLQELRRTGRQVAKTQEQVEEVKTVATKIEEGVQAVSQCVDQNEAIQERNKQISDQVEQTITAILTFDREQINCKGCETRIMMLPKGKERILKFHSSVVSDLTSLHASLADRGPGEP